MVETLTAKGEWRAGWSLAVACLAGMIVTSVAVYIIGALTAPIEREFHWSRAQITFGLTVSTLLGAVLSLVVGLMLDRWGPRRIGLPGAVLALTMISLLSLATSNYALWMFLWLCISLGSVGVKPTVWTMAIASSFEKSRGVAMAVTLCGSSVAAMVMPLLAIRLIDTYGWRPAIPMVCALVGVVLLPILYFGLHSQADAARNQPDKAAEPAKAVTGVTNVRDAVFSPQFAKLAAAAFIFTVCALGLVTNLIPILTSLAFSRTEAAAIAGLVGVASFIGRMLTGYLIDRFNSNMVAGLTVLLPLATCFLLLHAQGDMLLASIAVFLFGLSFGAEVDVVAYLAAEKFGMARYGTIFGFVTASWYLATATGPVLTSLAYDMTGSYQVAIKAAIPLFALVSLLLFTLGKPLPFDEPAQD